MLTVSQRSIADHLLIMLGVEEYKDIPEYYPPLTEKEADAVYHKEPGARTCTEKEFYIDFTRPWEGFHLNAEAAHVFANNYLRKAAAGGLSKNRTVARRFLTKDQVLIALARHIPYVKERYSMFRKSKAEYQMLYSNDLRRKANLSNVSDASLNITSIPPRHFQDLFSHYSLQSLFCLRSFRRALDLSTIISRP